jgi:4-diphosphocytidyl-2-C-methyl-D-erythritol kinase
LLDWGDTMRFSLTSAPGVHLSISGCDQLSTSNNLIVRAAHALAASHSELPGVQIVLDKRLPVGGGMGGGSSNAGTTLRVLNALWGLNLSRAALLSLALDLGADVPLFVGGQTALGTGVGEQLTLCALPPRWYVLLFPPVRISTATLFQDPRLVREAPVTSAQALLARQRNVFAPLLRADYPEIDAACRALAPYAEPQITGTGSTVFAAFDAPAQARQVAATLAEDFNTQVARGVVETDLKKMFPLSDD